MVKQQWNPAAFKGSQVEFTNILEQREIAKVKTSAAKEANRLAVNTFDLCKITT